MNKKIIYISAAGAVALIVFFLAFSESRVPVGFKNSPAETATTEAGKISANEKPSAAKTVAALPASYADDAANKEAVAPQASSSVSSETGIIKIDLVAGDSRYSANVPASSTAYDAMTALASTTDFRFKGEYFSGLGYFIEEINGKPNQNGYYWTLYVNGKYSNIGASQYALRDKDEVEWKYEKQ